MVMLIVELRAIALSDIELRAIAFLM